MEYELWCLLIEEILKTLELAESVEDEELKQKILSRLNNIHEMAADEITI